MDRNASHPLTPAEAKDRLRTAAQQVSLTNWLGQHKWPVLVVAIAAGFIIGRTRIPVITGTLLTRGFAPMLLNMFLNKRKEHKTHGHHQGRP